MEGLGEAATAASAGACVAELVVPYPRACATKEALKHGAAAAAAAAAALQPAVLACCPEVEAMASPNQREACPTSHGAPERTSPAGLVINELIQPCNI